MLIKRGGVQHPKQNEALGLNTQLLFAIINNLSDAVLALDTNLNIVISNGAALSLLNMNDLRGLPLNKAMSLIDKTGNYLDSSMLVKNSQDGFTSRDIRLKFYDGSTLNLYLSSQPVKLSYGADGGGYIVIMRDITSEKMVEDEREDFINVAGHELRTPVAIAEGSLSNVLIMAERSGASDILMQSLKTAHEQIIFLSSMINDLAVLSRADRGKMAMTIEKLKVSELVQELSSSYTPQARSKNLTLNFQVAPDAQELTSSRLYVNEILQNFITNSLKYTLAGGIQIAVDTTTNGIRFSVADTGIGISQSDQSKLFNKFFRSGDERVAKINGTGLGLYITGKLVELLGASLEISSELNKGSVFSIDFPNLEIPPKLAEATNQVAAQPLANKV